MHYLYLKIRNTNIGKLEENIKRSDERENDYWFDFIVQFLKL